MIDAQTALEISNMLHLIWGYCYINFDCMEEYVYYIVAKSLGGMLSD